MSNAGSEEQMIMICDLNLQLLVDSSSYLLWKSFVFAYNYIGIFYRDHHPVIKLDPVQKITPSKHLKPSYRILTLVKLRKKIII